MPGPSALNNQIDARISIHVVIHVCRLINLWSRGIDSLRVNGGMNMEER